MTISKKRKRPNFPIKISEKRFFRLKNEKLNSLNNDFDSDEIKKVESDFGQELRQETFPKDTLGKLIKSLNVNAASLSDKLKQMEDLSGKIRKYAFVKKAIDLDKIIYGKIDFS